MYMSIVWKLCYNYGLCMYSVSLKTDQNVFFCNIFDKAPVILIKFGTKFPE